jgi:ABC-2 type transport system ATP-binding protein
MSPSGPAVAIDGLRKSYGSLTAVDGITLEIRRGECFGLLGPNGAGKSTTLHCVVGALEPDEGTIQVDGEADPTRPALRARIGIAPQQIALYDDLTADENLTFFGAIYGLRGPLLRERIEMALEFAGLTPRRRDRVSTYSGGMQRRLNLIAGILHNPPVILLDEPTAGVDPQSRNAIFESIDSMKRLGKTIVYTTHYMEEAQRLCDRVAIVDRGRVLAVDTVEGLIRSHGGPPTVEIERPPRVEDGADSELAQDLGAAWEGDRLRVRTDRPLDVVGRLAARADAYTQIRIERADLEDVFLNLTGRNLRD